MFTALYMDLHVIVEIHECMIINNYVCIYIIYLHNYLDKL